MPISLRAIVTMAMQRLNGHRRLTGAVTVGVVLSVALMASIAIYDDALDRLGLQFELERVPPQEFDLRIATSSHLLAPDRYGPDQDRIERSLDRLGELIQERTRTATSATFFLAPAGEPLRTDDGRPRSRLQFLTDLDAHVVIDAGRLPSAAVARTDGAPPQVEAALGSEAATALGVQLGDRFDLYPFWREDAAPIIAEVVGLIRPQDHTERYWGPRRNQFTVATSGWDTFAFFVAEGTLSGAVVTYLPDTRAALETLARVDLDQIRPEAAADTARQVQQAAARITGNLDGTRVETSLPAVLESFTDKQFFSQLPLLVITLQVVAIVLYYIVMVSTMLVERQSGEIALLKSRGGGSRQLLVISALEGLLIAGLALALGPLLALGGVALLGLTPPFEGLSGGDALSVRMTVNTYLWALAGAGLALLALIWPAYRASGQSVVRFKRAAARPAGQALVQRYYLDVVVVVVAALLFFELENSGSLVTEDLFGGLDYDPLRLLAPAVFITAAALTFLRLFPPILALVSRVVERTGGVPVQLGLWHLVRAPVQHSRLVLLLIMAASLGMFTATFGATLDRSFDDRSAFEAGAPLRLSRVATGGLGVAAFSAPFNEDAGAARVSAVLRTGTSASAGAFQTARAELLGVDPDTLGDVAWFRSDFADRDLASLLASLRAPQDEPRPPLAPAEATALGLWVRIAGDLNKFEPSLRLRDADGRYLQAPLAVPAVDGEISSENATWQFLTIDLQALRASEALAAGPVAVLAIGIRPLGFQQFAAEIFFDGLQYSRAEAPGGGGNASGFPDGIVMEAFNEPGRWVALQDLHLTPVADTVRVSDAQSRDSDEALRYAYNDEGRRGPSHGIRLAGDETPIPVVVDRAFAETLRLTPGDRTLLRVAGVLVPVHVVDVIDLFPTHDPRTGLGLVLADSRALISRVNRSPLSGPEFAVNEAWIVPAADGGVERLRASWEAGAFGDADFFDGVAIRAAADDDPLTVAGWKGLLLIAFLAVLILSTLGFLVTSIFAAETRQLEVATLRTLGLSVRQLLATVSFEQLFVVVVAMGLGTVVGLRLGVLMLGFLNLTETGEAALPPLQTVTDWGTVAVAYGILALMFLVTIGVVVAAHARMALHRALRLGE